MPYALVVIGLVMVITGAQNTHAQLASQLRSDVTGFTMWAAAIFLIGAAGYVEKMRGASQSFMALVLIAMILNNKGFIARVQEALKEGPIEPDAPAASRPVGTGSSNPLVDLDNATGSDTLGKAVQNFRKWLGATN